MNESSDQVNSTIPNPVAFIVPPNQAVLGMLVIRKNLPFVSMDSVSDLMTLKLLRLLFAGFTSPLESCGGLFRAVGMTTNGGDGLGCGVASDGVCGGFWSMINGDGHGELSGLVDGDGNGDTEGDRGRSMRSLGNGPFGLFGLPCEAALNESAGRFLGGTNPEPEVELASPTGSGASASSTIIRLSILNGFPNMCCRTGVDSISLRGGVCRFRCSW